MKHALSFFFVCLAFSLAGQRFANFEVDLIQPADSTYVGSSLSLEYTLRIKNLGPDTLFKTDTVQIYLLLDSDTVYFTEVRTNAIINHLNFIDIDLPAGATHEIKRSIYMPHHKIGEVVDFCMIALPFLAGNNSIQDAYLSNNTSCKKIRVWTNPNPIETWTKAANFSLFPMPVSSTLKINTSFENFKVRIYTGAGQLMHMAEGVNEIDCSEFQSGIYFIHLITDSYSEIQRIQVLH